MPLIVTGKPHTRQPQQSLRLRPDWTVAWNFGAGVPGLSDYPPREAGPGGRGALVAGSYAGFASGAIAPGLTNNLTAVMLVEPLSTTGANNFTFGEAAPPLGAYNWGFYERSNGATEFFIHNGGSGVRTDCGFYLSALRRPVCVVATYDGATIRIYADGADLGGSAAQSGGIQRNASVTLSWAMWNVPSSPHARIYGAAVSPRAFSAAEIRSRLSSPAAAWDCLFAPLKRRIRVPGAGSTVPNITFVGAENILATSADYRTTLDYA